MQRKSSRRTRTSLVLSACLLSAGGTWLAVATSGGSATTASALDSPSLGVLSNTDLPAPGAGLAADLAKSSDIASVGGLPLRARRALTGPFGDLYVIPARTGAYCIAVVAKDGQRAGGCGELRYLRGGADMITIVPDGVSAVTFGVVADGITSVSAGGRAYAVRNNAFAVPGVRLSDGLRLELTGPGVSLTQG